MDDVSGEAPHLGVGALDAHKAGVRRAGASSLALAQSSRLVAIARNVRHIGRND
ncbi:hypothetical protein BVI1335_120030 [Burkholderia vietnamiensis]|nr:hypothetical protein BVI1335_120030 [Burkholderia vietnamiensis]